MQEGPYAAYPVVDMRVTVTDGSHHDVDSSEFAFTEASRVCFRELFMKTQPKLLEPIMSLEIVTPGEHIGDVTGVLYQRRGRIETLDAREDIKIVRGYVPLSEMFGFVGALRSLTQGRGTFSMQFEHYEAVPFAIAEEIMQKRNKAG